LGTCTLVRHSVCVVSNAPFARHMDLPISTVICLYIFFLRTYNNAVASLADATFAASVRRYLLGMPVLYATLLPACAYYSTSTHPSPAFRQSAGRFGAGVGMGGATHTGHILTPPATSPYLLLSITWRASFVGRHSVCYCGRENVALPHTSATFAV